MSQSQGKVKRGTNASNATRNCVRWSLNEDRALIDSINDLMEAGGWKANNGQFKSGAYSKLEALMELKLPGNGKKAKPHIESRVKLLRKQYDAITDMLSPSASGFGWNDEGKFVTCPQSVWYEWLKSHKNAAGLRNKPFPLFDEISKIFGKDRASGDECGNAQDMLDEMEVEERCDRDDDPVPDASIEQTNPTTQGSPTEPLQPFSPSGIPSVSPLSRQTKRVRTETIEALREYSTKVGKISDVMEVASEHIGRLASCFQHESDSAERRMQVPSEVMKINGLTPEQVLIASKKIALNPLEVDLFFSLPEDFRYAYVQSLLLSDSPNK